LKMSKKNESRTVRAVTRTNLGSGKTTRFVDEVREERWMQWSGKRMLVRGLLLYLSVASIVGLGQFVLMESVKNPSFSLGTCQTLLRSVSDNESRAGIVASCNQAFDYQQAQASWALGVNRAVGWINPFTAMVYDSFFVANVRNLGFERSLFESAVQAGVKPYVSKSTNSSVWTYAYQVVVVPESNTVQLQASLSSMAQAGWHVKSMYDSKVQGAWCVVIVFEKITT